MPIITQQAPLPTSAAVAPEPAPVRQPDKIETSDATSAESEGLKKDQLSPNYAALARKEKALRGQYQALKAKEAELKAKETEYQTSYIPKSELEKRIKSDPLGLMKEFGMTYDEVVNLALNQPSPQDQTIQALQTRIQELEAKQDKTMSRFDEEGQKNYDQALNQIRNEAKLLVDGQIEFETIKEAGATEAIVSLIEETFNSEGRILTVEEAAKEVENFLIEDALRMANFKKVQARLKPTEPAVESAPISKFSNRGTTKVEPRVVGRENMARPTVAMRTLTNSQSATFSKGLTREERRQRAMLAGMGQLPQN